jgi:hypothetical protein
MARVPRLTELAQRFDLKIVTVACLREHLEDCSKPLKQFSVGGICRKNLQNSLHQTPKENQYA